MSHRTAGTIGTLVLAAVTVLSYVTAVHYFSAPRLADGTFATLIPYNFEWLPFTETLTFNLGILLDPISVMMLIVISTVSLMVHIYSFGYMKGERGFQRYYAFLSLFTMSMLGLVVAIQLRENKPVWGRNCTHCMACICYCPTEAIEYGKKSIGKPRYQFEKLTGVK